MASEKTFVKFERAHSATMVVSTLLSVAVHALAGAGEDGIQWISSVILVRSAALSPQLGTFCLAIMNTQE